MLPGQKTAETQSTEYKCTFEQSRWSAGGWQIECAGLLIVAKQAPMTSEKCIERDGTRQSKCSARPAQKISPVIIKAELKHSCLDSLSTLPVTRPPTESNTIEFTNPPAFTGWKYRLFTPARRRITRPNMRENCKWCVGLEIDTRLRRCAGEVIDVACNKPDHFGDTAANHCFTNALLSILKHSLAQCW